MTNLAALNIDEDYYNNAASFLFFDAPAVGEESSKIRDLKVECFRQYLMPFSRQSEDIRIRFIQLKEKWKEDTAFLSSITNIALHPSYQQIIGMGKQIIPLIIEELKNTPDHWFWALKAITGADPVPPQKRGSINEMTEEWIRWWHENRP